MKRAAIYTRVSTRDQTPALQQDEARELVQRRGWRLVLDVGDVVSSQKEARPALAELMDAAKRRRFDVLVVWRADRVFRSVRHMVNTLAEFEALGVEFVSCTEPFDTLTPAGKLLFHMCAAFAQFERDVLVERTIAGVEAARRRGKLPGRPKRRFDVEAARAWCEVHPQRHVAEKFGVGLGTLQRALAAAQKGSR